MKKKDELMERIERELDREVKRIIREVPMPKVAPKKKGQK